MMMDKINVNGKNTHDIYKYLRANSKLWDADKQVAREIPWNFTKFLVSGDGKKIRYYHPKINPIQMRDDISKYLTKVNPDEMSREKSQIMEQMIDEADYPEYNEQQEQ